MSFTSPGRNGQIPPHPSSTSNHHQTTENFTKFYEQWLQLLNQDLHSLRSATENQQQSESQLRSLIDSVIAHYESYYHHKSTSAHRDILPMFNPPWASSTEHLFLWAGGWRPTIAFHLLYSKSGIQLETNLEKILRGIPTGDLAELSPQQLERIDELQRKTVRMEKEISEEEAKVQETVANREMVEVVNAISRGGDEVENQRARMEKEIEEKEEGMKRVLERGDQLRIETLKGVVGILRPSQAVHFLIAAAELHLRVHEFGRWKDARRSGTETDGGDQFRIT